MGERGGEFTVLVACRLKFSYFVSLVTLTLKMTTTQVVKTSVTVNNNSRIQDYVHPDDQTQPTFKRCYFRFAV